MKKLILSLVTLFLLASCSKQEEENCSIEIYLIRDVKEELIDIVPCGTDLSVYCPSLTTEKMCLVDGPMIYIARESK